MISKKHVRLNRAETDRRMLSCGKKSKHIASVEVMHMLETRSRKARRILEERVSFVFPILNVIAHGHEHDLAHHRFEYFKRRFPHVTLPYEFHRFICGVVEWSILRTFNEGTDSFSKFLLLQDYRHFFHQDTELNHRIRFFLT